MAKAKSAIPQGYQTLTPRRSDVGSRGMNQPQKQFSLNRTVKKQKGISVGVVTLLCFVLMASLQSAEPWKPLFNGQDFTGWTVPARSGPSPAEAGWKIENGIIVGGQAGPGQRGGSLVSQGKFKDAELELDFMLAEQPAAPNGSCATCTYNSGVSLRNGYQVNFGRREAGWVNRLRQRTLGA